MNTEPLLKQRLIPWGHIIIYDNKIVISGLITTKTIPTRNIANVYVNKLSQKIKIETSGGEKRDVTIAGSAEKVKEIIEKTLI